MMKAVSRKNKWAAGQTDTALQSGPAASASTVSSSTRETPMASKKRLLLDKFVASAGSGDNREKARLIESENHAYLNYDVGLAKTEIDNPLQFWKSREHMFPRLAVLARSYLSTSASSIPVESMFSTSGILLNQKCWLSSKCRFIYS